MKCEMKKFIITLTIILISMVLFSQNDITNPTNYINDYEDIFSSEEEKILNNMIKVYKDSTNIQITVVSIDSILNTEHELKVYLDEKCDDCLVIFISVASRKWIIIGYGLDSLLIDMLSINIGEKYFTETFRQGKYFKGMKDFLNATMNKIGIEDYTKLIKNKEVDNVEAKESLRNFGNNILIFISIVVFIILVVIFIKRITRKFKKRKELSLNIDITHNEIIKRKEDLLKTLNKIPSEIQKTYNDNITNQDIKVDNDTYNRLLYVLKRIKDYQSLIYNTNRLITEIMSEERQLKKYLDNNHEHCSDYLKSELRSYLPNMNNNIFTSTEFTKERLVKLKSLNNSLNMKRQNFLKKTYTITDIISDYKSVNDKVKELYKSYEKYKNNKSFLISSPVGKRLQHLAKIDIEQNILNMKEEVKKSFLALENDDYKSANYHHGIYTTILSVLNGAFSSVSNLVSFYKRSDEYVKDNKGKIESKIKDIKNDLYKSDVKNYRRNELSSIKSKVKKFNNNIDFDIILAASLLKEILKSLDSLYSDIKNDIRRKNELL